MGDTASNSHTLARCRFFRSPLQKTSYIAVSMIVCGLLMCSLPFVHDFGLLAALRIAQYVALGSFITADASMLVYTMGPVVSR